MPQDTDTHVEVLSAQATASEPQDTSKIIQSGYTRTLWKSTPKTCQQCKCIYTFDENDATYLDRYTLTRLMYKKPYEFQRHDESIIRVLADSVETTEHYLGVQCPECLKHASFYYKGLPDIVISRIKARNHRIIFKLNSSHSQIMIPEDFECIAILDCGSFSGSTQIAYRYFSNINNKNIILFPDQIHESFKNQICHKTPTLCTANDGHYGTLKPHNYFEHYYPGQVNTIEDRSCCTIL
jgi:hypothetical protein